jgi:phosphopantetheinyl transferase (holo-ACP synthase)
VSVDVVVHADPTHAWAIAALEYDRRARPASLLATERLDAVFTASERRVAARKPTLDTWAGRLAAKHAIGALIERCTGDAPTLADIEVLPAPDGRCVDPFRCLQGHPLRVRVRSRPDLDPRITVSVSHERRLAVALAGLLRSPSSTPGG